MEKETVIGIVWKHDYNDYELILGDFPKWLRDKISQTLCELESDDDYSFCHCRGDKKMCLEDANISYFDERRYVNTGDPTDIVTLPEIFKRYYDINGSAKGFEEYVESKFDSGNGYKEYKEI